MTENNHATAALKINSRSRLYVKKDIYHQDVYRWLRLVYDRAGGRNLRIDLKKCYSYVNNEEQVVADGFLTDFLHLEASGDIHPPVNLCKSYERLAILLSAEGNGHLSDSEIIEKIFDIDDGKGPDAA